MIAKGLFMTVVALVVAGGTYFGLGAAFPQQQPEPAGPRLASVEQVFSGELKPPQNGTAEAEPALPADSPDSDPAALEAAATADDADTFAEDDAATQDDAANQTGTEVAQAEDETADTADADTAAADEPTDADTAAADEPTDADSAGAAEPQPAAAAPATQAAPAQPPATQSAPPPAAKPATQPTEPRQPAAKPATKPAAKPAAPPASAQKLPQWWGQESDQRLSIVYAGSAAYTRAIVLMFNGAFDDVSSAARHLRVTDDSGKTVKGSWQIGESNKRMLLFPVAQPGVYTVSVAPELADRAGRKHGQSLKGPVRVQ